MKKPARMTISIDIAKIILGIALIITLSKLTHKALNIWSWTKTQETMTDFNGNCRTEFLLDGYRVSITCTK